VDNWYGMPYGVLDETPTPTPGYGFSAPSVGDYLSMFQSRNRAWRESMKPAYNTPYLPTVQVDEAVADAILNPNGSRNLLSAWERQPNGGGDGPTGTDSEPSSPSVDGPASPDSIANTVDNMTTAATGLGIVGGIPGLGLATTIGANVVGANAMDKAFGKAYGLPANFDALSAIGHDMSFGAFGHDLGTQNAAQTPGIADSAFGTGDDHSDSPGGVDPTAGVDPAAAAAGVADAAFGDPAGGDDSGDKIVCTAMNAAYGFGSFRQAIWLAHSRKLPPEYQRGYHVIFQPLVDYGYAKDGLLRSAVRRALEHIARRRTADIWKQKRGKRDLVGAAWRIVLEPLCYLVGKVK